MEESGRPRDAEGEKRRRRLTGLLPLLFLLSMTLSAVTGYLLGRNASQPSGQLVDTITIGPETPAAVRTIHMSGQILTDSGEPYRDGVVRLHSQVREAVTDGEGRFFFEDVEPGEHTIEVVDQGENVLARSKVELRQQAAAQTLSVAGRAQGDYTVKVSVDVRFVEFTVYLYEDAARLELALDRVYALTDEGALLAPAGAASVDRGAVAFPSGTVVTADHTVVLPGALILPDNTVVPRSGGDHTTGDGAVVRAEGGVLLPDGSVIGGDGAISRPGGQAVQPADGPYQILPGDTLPVLAGTETPPPAQTAGPDVPSPAPSPADAPAPTPAPTPAGDTAQASPAPAATPEPDHTPGPSPVPTGGPAPGPSPAPTAGPEASPAPTPTPAPTQVPAPTPTPPGGGGHGGGDHEPPVTPTERPGEISVSESADGTVYTGWRSTGEIDLFRNREDTAQSGAILPGSKGYYLFRLQNGGETGLAYEIALAEEKLHLPLRFRLAPDGEGGGAAWSEPLPGPEAAEISLTTGEIPAGGAQLYRLEWEWPLDSGSDETDTRAGSLADGERVYLLRLTIRY